MGRLAQLEEHLVYTERVGGSRPSPPTIPPKSLLSRQSFFRAHQAEAEANAGTPLRQASF
jgi:hypothetical protein